jgi:hypothetical protein
MTQARFFRPSDDPIYAFPRIPFGVRRHDAALELRISDFGFRNENGRRLWVLFQKFSWSGTGPNHFLIPNPHSAFRNPKYESGVMPPHSKKRCRNYETAYSASGD